MSVTGTARVKGESIMTEATKSIVAAMEAAKGRIVVVVSETAPVSDAVMAKRVESAAKRVVADGRGIARVKTIGVADDGGAVVTVAGRYDAKRGVVVAKSGNESVALLLSAPEEYGMPTACPSSSREGSACFGMAPRHGHRAFSTARIVSIATGGVTLYQREA
jgi:hypothetical protein